MRDPWHAHDMASPPVLDPGPSGCLAQLFVLAQAAALCLDGYFLYLVLVDRTDPVFAAVVLVSAAGAALLALIAALSVALLSDGRARRASAWVMVGIHATFLGGLAVAMVWDRPP